MPVDENQIGGFTPYVPGLPDEALEKPSLSKTLGSAFAMENDIVAGVELLTQPFFEKQEDFNFGERLKEEEDLVLNYQDSFMGVQSDAQFNYTVNKIKQEEANRDVLARSGTAGIVSAIAAGVISPTVFIPLVGASSRGLKALTEGAMLGASAGAIQAATLYAAQETRSPTDVLIDIGAGAVVGGLLGVAARELDAGAMARIERQMSTGVDTQLDQIVPERGSSFEASTDSTVVAEELPSAGTPTPAGAAVKDTSTTAFLKGLG